MVNFVLWPIYLSHQRKEAVRGLQLKETHMHKIAQVFNKGLLPFLPWRINQVSRATLKVAVWPRCRNLKESRKCHVRKGKVQEATWEHLLCEVFSRNVNEDISHTRWTHHWIESFCHCSQGNLMMIWGQIIEIDHDRDLRVSWSNYLYYSEKCTNWCRSSGATKLCNRKRLSSFLKSFIRYHHYTILYFR